jgi:hypothetical protein
LGSFLHTDDLERAIKSGEVSRVYYQKVYKEAFEAGVGAEREKAGIALANIEICLDSIRSKLDGLIMSILGKENFRPSEWKISREQAKAEIAELFKKSVPSETLFSPDIAEKLHLDLELVVELCSELRKEREIKKEEVND